MNTFILLWTSLLGTLAVLASVAKGTADDTGFPQPRATDSPAATTAVADGPADSAQRIWADATGKFSVEAELVKVVGDSVVLRTADGTERTVALARLSAADRQYVQDRGSGNPAVVAQWEAGR